MMDSVVMFEGSIFEDGYGLIARKVMRDKNLKHQAKAIYAYICSFAQNNANNERVAFPSISLQVAELGMGEDTYYKHRKALIEKGYLKIEQIRGENGKFNRNLYKIVLQPVPQKDSEPYPKKSGMEDKPYPKKPSSVKPTKENPSKENLGTKSNSIKSNSIKSNRFKIVNKVDNKDDNPFSAEGLKKIAMDLYFTHAPGRWSKKQYKTLVDKMIVDVLDGEEFLTKANDPFSYIQACVERCCLNHDIKKGKAQPKYLEVVSSNIPHFDWLGENDDNI